MPVTDADLEHVRNTYLELNRLYDSVREGDLEDYYRRFYAPDAVVEHMDDFPLAGRFEGYEGYRDGFIESFGTYRDVNFEIVSIEPVGDRVHSKLHAAAHRCQAA